MDCMKNPLDSPAVAKHAEFAFLLLLTLSFAFMVLGFSLWLSGGWWTLLFLVVMAPPSAVTISWFAHLAGTWISWSRPWFTDDDDDDDFDSGVY